MTTNLDTSYVFSGLRPFTGPLTAPGYGSSGLTGATAASRYVGATASGAPGSGTFLLGDFVVDQSGSFWVCTVAGSPGTWTHVSGGGGGGGSPLTTKGDIFTHSSVDARLPVGSNGFVLNADSAQTLGIGWSTINLNVNGNKVTNMANATVSTDAVAFRQVVFNVAQMWR